MEAHVDAKNIGQCLLELWILDKRHRGDWSLQVFFISVAAEACTRMFSYSSFEAVIAPWDPTRLASSSALFSFFVYFSVYSWYLFPWIKVPIPVPFWYGVLLTWQAHYWNRLWRHICKLFNTLLSCWEPAWGILPVAKVMRKEAWHTQRRDQASGVPLDILEHLPPNQSLPTLLQYAFTYTSDIMGGYPPPPLSEKELT